MQTITITLFNERMAKLREIAAHLHISSEELARAGAAFGYALIKNHPLFCLPRVPTAVALTPWRL